MHHDANTKTHALTTAALRNIVKRRCQIYLYKGIFRKAGLQKIRRAIEENLSVYFFFFDQYFIYIICIRKILEYNDERIRIYLCRERTSAVPDVMRN